MEKDATLLMGQLLNFRVSEPINNIDLAPLARIVFRWHFSTAWGK